MSNREFYQETFSQIHGHKTVRWEDFAHMGKKRRRLPGRLLAVAAVLCILTALSAAAVAANLLGLRDLLLPQRERVGVVDEEGFLIPGESQSVDMIGLSGWLDTPESQALAQWRAFLDGYDRNHAILDSLGNEIDYELWASYPCNPEVYTREMGERLDEIAASYGLKLHTAQTPVDTRADWIALTGGDFLGDSNSPAPGWMYEDGTFHFDGEGYVSGFGILDYQFDRMVRGSFNNVVLNVGDVSSYAEWRYETAGGVTVDLALGPDKALVLAELADSFVTINVLLGTEQSLTEETLEAFADSFAFDLLTPALPLADG